MIDAIVDIFKQILVMNNQNRQRSFLLRVRFGKRPRPLSKQSHIKEQDTKGHSVYKTCQFISLLSGQKRADWRVRCSQVAQIQSLKSGTQVLFTDPSKSSTADHNF